MFIEENAFENIVCEVVATLSKGRWVKGVKSQCNVAPEGVTAGVH